MSEGLLRYFGEYIVIMLYCTYCTIYKIRLSRSEWEDLCHLKILFFNSNLMHVVLIFTLKSLRVVSWIIVGCVDARSYCSMWEGWCDPITRYSPFQSCITDLVIARLTMHHGTVFWDANKKPVPQKQSHDALPTLLSPIL